LGGYGGRRAKKIEEFCFVFDDVEDGILGFVA
jgi:hypothetical protein